MENDYIHKTSEYGGDFTTFLLVVLVNYNITP